MADDEKKIKKKGDYAEEDTSVDIGDILLDSQTEHTRTDIHEYYRRTSGPSIRGISQGGSPFFGKKLIFILMILVAGYGVIFLFGSEKSFVNDSSFKEIDDERSTSKSSYYKGKKRRRRKTRRRRSYGSGRTRRSTRSSLTRKRKRTRVIKKERMEREGHVYEEETPEVAGLEEEIEQRPEPRRRRRRASNRRKRSRARTTDDNKEDIQADDEYLEDEPAEYDDLVDDQAPRRSDNEPDERFEEGENLAEDY